MIENEGVAVQILKLCNTDEPPLGVTMNPDPCSPKFKYLLPTDTLL